MKKKKHIATSSCGSIYSFLLFFSFFTFFLADDLILDGNSQRAVKTKTTNLQVIQGINSKITKSGRIIMTGLIIAIKNNGFLAVSKIAAPIWVLHTCMCRKVSLPRLRLTTLWIDNTWPLLVCDHPRMCINAGVNIKVYVFDTKCNYRQFESRQE